jgi:hypothetical protein
MSCTALTRGRTIDCRTSAGGVKAIYLAPLSAADTLVVANGEVTDLELNPADLYKYELKRGLASVTETIVGSTENGSIYYTPSVNIKLHKLTKEDQNEIKLLASQRLLVFAELNATEGGKNVILCLGRNNGLELNSGTATSGAALGDMSGYDFTFDGMEIDPMSIVEPYSTVPFDNAGFTVTVS